MERFFDYVLIQSLYDWGWGEVFLAVHAPGGTAGKVVWLARLNPDLPLQRNDFIETLRTLLPALRKELSDPILTLPLEERLDDARPYYVFEPIIGRSLRQVIETSREQYVPLTVDHVLLITNQINSGLQLLHQIEFQGMPVFHGLITPDQIFVTDEGQVKVIYGGITRALGSGDTIPGFMIEHLGERLAPEQREGHPGGPRSDIYQSARLTLELFQNQFRDTLPDDIRTWLVETRIFKPSGEQAPLPDHLLEIFLQALQTEPSKRFSRIEKLKDPLDELTFGGEYEASTFNLAFYMNTLFSATFEEVRKLNEDLLKQDYQPVFQAVEAADAAAELESSLNAFAAELETEVIETAGMGFETPEEVIELESSEAESDVIMPESREEDLYPSMQRPEKKKAGVPVIPMVIGAAVIVVGLIVYFMQGRMKPTPVQTAKTTAPVETKPNPEVLRLQKELEEQRKQIEMLTQLLQQAQTQEQDGKETSAEENRKLREQLQQALKRMSKLEKELQRRSTPTPPPPERPAPIRAQATPPPSPTAEEQKASETPPPATPSAEEAKPVSPAESQPVETKEAPPVEPETEAKPAQAASSTPESEATPSTRTGEGSPESTAEPPSQPPPRQPAVQSKPPTIVEPVLAVNTDQGTTGLKPISSCRPDYPSILRRQQVRGTVIYQVIIDRNGRVESIRILKSPHPLLADAVREALSRKSCRFPRATVKGKPVRARITGTFIFRP